MKNKKGLAILTLVILIIILVTAIPLLLFGGELAAMIGEEADIKACRLSLLAQAKLKTAGKSPVSAECPRKKIIFYNNYIEEYVGGHKRDVKVNIDNLPQEKFNELTNDIVNQVIAEELRLCWFKTGEGMIDVFEEAMVFGVAKDKVCLLCSTLEFDDEVDKTEEFTGLMNYLKSHNLAKDGESISYYDYLSKKQLIEAFWIDFGKEESLQLSNLNKITPEQKYVVFMMAGKANALDDFFGITEDTYFVIAGHIDRITSAYKGKSGEKRKLCEVLLN